MAMSRQRIAPSRGLHWLLGTDTPCVWLRRVGTGVSDAERKAIRERLEPYMVEAKDGKRKPSCYVTTDTLKERPDVWISDPTKSIVLEVRCWPWCKSEQGRCQAAAFPWFVAI